MNVKKDKKGCENIMSEEKALTLRDVLTQEEKEMIEEYRRLMCTTWSKWKSDRYFQAIMDILDEAEERYFRQKKNKVLVK